MALASIQALYGKLLERDAEISAVKAENQALRQELERLEARMDSLEAGRDMGVKLLPWIGAIALAVLAINRLENYRRGF